MARTSASTSFTPDGTMALQCRGHLITEGMHPQYDLFKQWAAVKRPVLEAMLEDRLILFGEWVYARHSVHVWTHMKMVCAQLPLLEEWPGLTASEQVVHLLSQELAALRDEDRLSPDLGLGNGYLHRIRFPPDCHTEYS